MGLGQGLANIVGLSPIYFQVQILRIWAWVDSEVGGIDQVVSGAGCTYWASKNPNLGSTGTNAPKF